MAAKGTPKFDLLLVTEIRADFKAATSTLVVTAAYADSTTGETHGWTKGTQGWSAETLSKLAELRQLVENDLAARDFEGGGASSTKASDPGLSLGGIAEHVGSDSDTDASQA